MSNALKRHLHHDHQMRESTVGAVYLFGDVVYRSGLSQPDLERLHTGQHELDDARMRHVHPFPHGGRV